MSFNASILIAGVVVARFFLKKAPKYIRKVLWGLVGLRLALPFSFESALSLMPTAEEVREISDVTQITDQVYEGASNGASFHDVAFCIWFVVFSAFLIYGTVSWLKLKFKLSDAVLLRDNIYQTEKIDSPFVLGLIKPKIYISYNINEKDLHNVILHENQHIAYGDHIFKIIGFLLLIIHWFNPFVWIAYILFCKDVELACDEGAVKKLPKNERNEYALALLNLGVKKVRVTACPVAFGETGIKERVKSVVAYKKASKFIIASSLVVCLCLAVTLMTKPETVEPKSVDTEKVVAEIPEETTTEPVTESVTESVTEPVTEPETTEKSTTKKPGNKNSGSVYRLSDEDIEKMKSERDKMILEAAQRTEDELFYANHGYYPPKETEKPRQYLEQGEGLIISDGGIMNSVENE